MFVHLGDRVHVAERRGITTPEIHTEPLCIVLLRASTAVVAQSVGGAGIATPAPLYFLLRAFRYRAGGCLRGMASICAAWYRVRGRCYV